MCFCWGTDRGMPVPHIMLGVEVACYGLLPLVQFLAKVADLPVASLTGAWGRVSAENCVLAVAVLTLGSMSLLCRSSYGSWGLSVSFGEVGGGAHLSGDELN